MHTEIVFGLPAIIVVPLAIHFLMGFDKPFPMIVRDLESRIKQHPRGL